MTSLNPVLTVGNQISEGIRAHIATGGVARAGKRWSMPTVHRIQRGMRIAIALSAEPEIQSCSMTALDVTLQAQILEVLDRLRATRGMAVLLITHEWRAAGRAPRGSAPGR